MEGGLEVLFCFDDGGSSERGCGEDDVVSGEEPFAACYSGEMEFEG